MFNHLSDGEIVVNHTGGTVRRFDLTQIPRIDRVRSVTVIYDLSGHPTSDHVAAECKQASCFDEVMKAPDGSDKDVLWHTVGQSLYVFTRSYFSWGSNRIGIEFDQGPAPIINSVDMPSDAYRLLRNTILEFAYEASNLHPPRAIQNVLRRERECWGCNECGQGNDGDCGCGGNSNKTSSASADCGCH